MNLMHCEAKQLLGITIRTKNEDEQSLATAKIPALWQKFHEEIYEQVLQGTPVYGVYTSYESDYTGYFDVSAAVEKSDNNGYGAHIQTITLQEGSYLKFTPKTTGENQIRELWEQVWAFFSDEQQKLKRAYTTDYEAYYPSQEVELYIAVYSVTAKIA